MVLWREIPIIQWRLVLISRQSQHHVHDYGQKLAEETLALIEDFLSDVKNLKKVIDNA